MLCRNFFVFPLSLKALPVVLKGLEVTINKERLQSRVRQYIHRMICLGDELLKSIPLIVSLLFKDAEVSCWGFLQFM